MRHIAIQEALDGRAVDWMEHVTDDEYAARPRAHSMSGFQARPGTRGAGSSDDNPRVMFGSCEYCDKFVYFVLPARPPRSQ